MPRTAVDYEETGVGSGTPKEYAGYAIRDPRGRKVGGVEKVFVSEDGEPQYIEMKMGLFGLKSVLLPVQSVAVDRERRALVLE